MDSRIRGNDRVRDSGARGITRWRMALPFVIPASSVVPAKAGTHASNHGWIPFPSVIPPRALLFKVRDALGEGRNPCVKPRLDSRIRGQNDPVLYSKL